MKTILLTVLGVCFLATGCAPPTVWEAEAQSPNGDYIAIARTVQNGGFGSAEILTTVSLKPAHLPNRPMEVLEFSCEGPVPRPYTLDNIANAGGTIDLTMKWVTPSQLSVTYNGRGGTLEFQAVKYQGVGVSLNDVSSDQPGSGAQSQ